MPKVALSSWIFRTSRIVKRNFALISLVSMRESSFYNSGLKNTSFLTDFQTKSFTFRLILKLLTLKWKNSWKKLSEILLWEAQIRIVRKIDNIVSHIFIYINHKIFQKWKNSSFLVKAIFGYLK